MPKREIITDDAMHDASALPATLEAEARKHAAAVALGMIADDLSNRMAAELGLPPDAIKESPLLAISLAITPHGTRQ